MVKKKRITMYRPFYCLLFMFMSLFTATGSSAVEKKPTIELKVSAAKEFVKMKEGKRIVEMQPAEETVQGDILVYTVSYRNTGQSLAKEVVVVDPIPPGTTYLPKSASGLNTKILFSINGGATYLEPPVYFKSRNASGVETSQPAPPEMYTHVKWIVQVPLKPGESGKTSFRVKVK